MALVRNHLDSAAPRPRRGHVGWTYKQKAYFTGGYTEIAGAPPGMGYIGRRSQLLHDIHCLDVRTVSWLSECPFPEPSTYLDGHTASWVGTKLVLIAGGTYPEGHDPNLGFSLTCSSSVYILETNPLCNPDGSLPALEWRSLSLVHETPEDHQEDIGMFGNDDEELEEDLEDLNSDEEAWEDEEDGDEDNHWGNHPNPNEPYPDDDEADLEALLRQHIEAAPHDDHPINLLGHAAGPHAAGPHAAMPALPNAPNHDQPQNHGLRHVLAQAMHAGRNLLDILPRFGFAGNNAIPEGVLGNARPGVPDANVLEHQTSFASGTPYLRPRVWHSATVVGNRIYVIGGRDMQLRYFGDVTYFDMETEKFVRVTIASNSPKLPPRAAHGAVCPDDRHIYVFGGRYKYPTVAHNGLTHRHYNDLWVFDTRNNAWKLLIDPPESDPSKYMKQPVHPLYQAATDPIDQDEAQGDENTLSHSFGSNPFADDPDGEKLSIHRASSKDPEDYPAPRCCFVMVLDPDLPHRAHLVGGYTSSNVCFYYIGDAWTLDLLDLSWNRMKFLPESDHLNRVSIHTPTYFYDELLLFAGEGSVDVPEVPYGSQQFLPYMTVFSLPPNKFSDVLRYRDPVAYNYYQLSLRSDLSDVTLEIGAMTFRLHRVVVAARMKRLHHLLLESGEWSTISSLSLSSSLGVPLRTSLKSSQRASYTSQVCTLSAEVWDHFIRASMPHGFFKTFKNRIFEPEILSHAVLFAYTDGIHKIHRLAFDQLVQLYHFGLITDLKRLSAIALEQISERLDPHFPSSEVGLIAELIAVTLHYYPASSSTSTTHHIPKLIDALIWHYTNSITAGTTHGTRQQLRMQHSSKLGPDASDLTALASLPTSTASSSSPLHSKSNMIRITPDLIIPKPSDYSSTAPSRDIDQVAQTWLQYTSGAHASLSEAMQALFVALNEDGITRAVEGDFELFVPSSAANSGDDAMDESLQEDLPPSSQPSVSTSKEEIKGQESEEKGMSLTFPPLSPYATPIVVHKNILIFSSSYLKGLLSNSFQETQQGYALVSELPYPMERTSLSALVQFMYGGSVQHIQDKNIALDILCNVPFFYSQRQELLKPLPHLGQRSTRLLRPRSLEIDLMTHCIDVVLSDEVTNDELDALQELAKTLNLVQFAQRLGKYSTKNQVTSHFTSTMMNE